MDISKFENLSCLLDPIKIELKTELNWIYDKTANWSKNLKKKDFYDTILCNFSQNVINEQLQKTRKSQNQFF